MANTANFGFKKFPPGNIGDDGNQFTFKDREVMDALFWSLFNHTHGAPDDAALAGPSSLVFPEVTLEDMCGVDARPAEPESRAASRLSRRRSLRPTAGSPEG